MEKARLDKNSSNILKKNILQYHLFPFRNFYGLLKIGKEIPDELLAIDVIPFEREDAILSSKIEIKMEKVGTKVPRINGYGCRNGINRRAKPMTLDLHFKEIAKFFDLELLS